MIMRYFYKTLVLMLCCFTLMQLHTSCKKDWLDVNYNPGELTDSIATPNLLLSPLLGSCIATSGTKIFQGWMGYWAYSKMPSGSPEVTYNNIQADGSTFQATPRAEIYYFEKKAKQSGQTFYEGIAKVIRALQWSRSVDVVNNMPYTDAYNFNVLQPRYDDGKFIYEDLMVQLNTAIDLIKAADMNKNIKLSVSDIMFHGDKTKWVKFINTLKLRLLVHQANRTDRAAYISTEITKIVTEGSGFLGSGEDAAVNPGYVINKRLSYYFGKFSSHNYMYGGADYDALTGILSYQLAQANIFAMNLLKENKDPRLGFFYSTVNESMPSGVSELFTQLSPSNYRGNQFGYFVNDADYLYQNDNYVSSVGGSRNTDLVNPSATGIIKGRNMSDWVMTSTESLFLQAEAIQRGWIAGDAEEAYKAAVKESFRWLNVGGNSNMPTLSDGVFDNWYNDAVTANNPNVSWAAAPDKYKLLMFQKYMAFNGIEPLETWTDYRRNGRYPNIPVSASPARVSTTIPTRLLYNRNEYIVNTANANAQGTITVNSKIWWMP